MSGSAHRSPRTTGFTLVEILIVFIILAVLTVVAISTYEDYVTRSRIKDKPTAVDRELSKLRWENVAFVAPEQVEMGSVSSVQVSLGGGKSISELNALLEAAGQKDGKKIRVSDRMEATLTSAGFQITPVTPTTQLTSATTPTLWKWDIKPTEYGTPKLSLSLNALVSVDGKDGAQSLKTFHRNISVRVTTVSGVWGFIEAYRIYLGGLCTAVLLPVIGYLFKRHRSGAAP